MIDLTRHHGDKELLGWIKGLHISCCYTRPDDGIAELKDYVDNRNDGGRNGDTPDATLTWRRWHKTERLEMWKCWLSLA